jgi:hypothetical protein
MCCNLWVGVVCVCVFFLLPIPTTGMDKWTIQECEASSCGEWNRSSTVDCLLFKSTTSLSYDCSAESHWFSASFAIPSFLHMGRLQIASSGNAQKTKRLQNIQGMASKHQICMKTPWLGSTKSLWKLHGFGAPNLSENSTQPRAIREEPQTRGRLLGPRLTQTGDETRSRDENSVQVKKQTGDRLISFLT